MAKTIDAATAARAIAEALNAGRDLVTITVIDGEHAGARYLSPVAGDVKGSLSPVLDALASELVAEVWKTRAPVLQHGMFAELHAVAEPLFIFGAGHIAVPLANFAHELGFAVTVLDDRAEFATSARFSDGVHVRTLDLDHPLADITITPNTFIVLVTRAHEHDFDCLRAVLAQSVLPRYIGMIGSKRRVRAAFKALLDGGVSRELLAHVNAPIGVEIGAETPAEIAISIAAELIQVRRRVAGSTKGTDARILDRMFPETAAQ